MVFLDFLFHNSGDELNFPFTIKMFQKIILDKNFAPRIFNFCTFDAKHGKECSKLVVGRDKKYGWKINLLNYFQFRLNSRIFLNIWLSKSFNRGLLIDSWRVLDGPREFSRTNFSVRWSLTCTWTCYFSKIVALTWNRFPPNSDANIPFWNYYFEIAAVAIYVLNN